jgi:hypothetical protein
MSRLFALLATLAHVVALSPMVDSDRALALTDSPRVPIWMFWAQGVEDLYALRDSGGKYRYAYHCIQYWQRLNQGYEVRLLDDLAASELSPSYRALKDRQLPLQLRADVLRLDLLSLYGVACGLT